MSELKRAAEQWAKCDPKAMARMSEPAIMYALADAKSDVLRMHAEIKTLRAAQAADSVLEDAARLDFLIEQRAYVVSDPDACPGYWLHFIHKETGKCWVQCDEHPTPRSAIDAARTQGANHD